MKIVGISACTIGIAHTYIAQEKIETAAKKAGDEVKIETQGTIGIENELDSKDIKNADIVLLAVDVKISGEERFKGKKVIKVSTETAIKSPNKLISKLHEIVDKDKQSLKTK
ncbi:PTS fructose transporter subunit IIB [Oenococcus oeni]|uniref:PTS fructose transporter subunit IIB n=1 Tax=Oenococcus oeni TaxID=1247 RepID=UPI00050DA92E|nr:PTS fructose transporter subunit IIB [Oenococcus oeni]AVI94392.1 PTS fructose transporter subunit IIB [Oenococcus oeni]KGH99037.1 PTS fructose transporter subunit IIB [Oenococcus oeni IOEB_1491]KGI05144.1 PTS fructose transporter subunit IIB [Oenococcus oeni S19]OIL71293.1 PTS fructose transporter subunit IIB [Oenococcus oeni]OIM03317.1 PTS fructose transporter subunit IIB [Oenococcus oeni]